MSEFMDLRPKLKDACKNTEDDQSEVNLMPNVDVGRVTTRSQSRAGKHYDSDVTLSDTESDQDSEAESSADAVEDTEDKLDDSDHSSEFPSGGGVDGVSEVKNFQNWAKSDLAEAQLSDPELAIVYGWVKDGYKPKWEEVAGHSVLVKQLWARFELLELVDNALFIRWEHADVRIKPRWRIVVPAKLYGVVMQYVHDAASSGGHQGVKRTLNKLKRSHFYWPGMYSYAMRWIRVCLQCGARKSPRYNKRTFLKKYQVGSVMDRVSIDLCGPFRPRTTKGNKWILTITDHFTRWIEAFPLREATAERIVQKVVEFVARYGMPLEIHSDCGKNVDGTLIRDVCRALGIRKTHTAPYHPQGNAITERENAVIKNMLSAYVNTNQTNWDDYLPLVMMAMRSSVHRVLKETPNMMMLGREVRLPYEAMLDLPADPQIKQLASEYAQQLIDAMRLTHLQVLSEVAEHYRYMKKDYDRFVKSETYVVGDAVWCREFGAVQGRSNSLANKYSGPWIVTGVLSSVTYRIERSRAKPRIVHGDRLKFYYGEVHDSWAKKRHKQRTPGEMLSSEIKMYTASFAEVDWAAYKGCIPFTYMPVIQYRSQCGASQSEDATSQ